MRDATARFPRSIDTRENVFTLIRDSQYIVEDVSDAQVNQVISGALDYLHYECDPCVQFYGHRKLWVYLHSERVEEYFFNNYVIQFDFSFVLFDVFWSTKDHGEFFDALTI